MKTAKTIINNIYGRNKKHNPFTPVLITLRPCNIYRHGIENTLSIVADWLPPDRATLEMHEKYSVYAPAVERMYMHDLEWVNIDLSIYSYLTEGWC